jgi:hypothetical protein
VGRLSTFNTPTRRQHLQNELRVHGSWNGLVCGVYCELYYTDDKSRPIGWMVKVRLAPRQFTYIEGSSTTVWDALEDMESEYRKATSV